MRFYTSIVIPSIIAIGLFVLTIFTIILPTFERNIMDKKKEMISELTNTAWSLIEEYHNEYKNQTYNLEEAQTRASLRVKQIRYGAENKDYFWIIDKHPRMIMHPYRNELINSDLNNYKDPNGKKLFVEATYLVEQEGEGFIDYYWQWKDDSTRIVPKLSYVKAFEPWGWIVGTGIYLEDVNEEIKSLKNKLLRASLIITLLIIAIILFVIRQSLIIERKRKSAEDDLLLSRQKYKSLVEASTEGTLMFLNKKVIFSNLKFSRLSGYSPEEITILGFEDIFNADWDYIISSFEDPQKSISIETKLRCNENSDKDVVISVSKIKYSNEYGYVVIAKEVGQKVNFEKEISQLSNELQTSLLLMNQPIRCFVNNAIKCSSEASIQEASSLMSRKNSNVVFVRSNNNIIGVINNNDLKERVLAEKFDPNRSVIEIMTSPVIALSQNALLFEAVLLLKKKNISHLAVKDDSGEIYGVIGYEDITKMQQNTVSYLIKEIEVAEDIESLRIIHSRVPVLVNALIESGDKIKNITRIITSVTDAITKRIIILAIEEFGEPPCDFAFMVLGSEGREEQTLSTDQDNAIVFEDRTSEELEKCYAYFMQMGTFVSQNLNVVGYKLCEGEIMAKNPRWTQPLSTWKNYFTEWIGTSAPQSILDSSIFFDFRCVYGNENISDGLRQHVFQALEGKAFFFYHMAQSIIKFKPPVNVFGNIVGNIPSKESVNLDIKMILLPIITFIRLYSLFNKLEETNSLARIKQLFKAGIINKSINDELVLSYNYLMSIRFRTQARNILANDQPNNIIDIKSLTHIEIATLKKIFNEISYLQNKLNVDFKGGVG